MDVQGSPVHRVDMKNDCSIVSMIIGMTSLPRMLLFLLFFLTFLSVRL